MAKTFFSHPLAVVTLTLLLLFGPATIPSPAPPVGFATYVLEVDWSRDGNFTGVDSIVTSQVFDITYRRGRNFASQLTGRATPGTLTAQLYNPDGLYNRFNTASPLYGKLDAGAKVRLSTSWPVAEILWQGYLDMVQPNVQVGHLPMATLSAVGPLGYLAGKKISTRFLAPAQLLETHVLTTGVAVAGDGADYVATALGSVGWAAADVVRDLGQVRMTGWYASEQDVVAALRDLEATEGGYLGESSDGKIVFEDRIHRLSPPHTVPQATWTDAVDGALSYGGIAQLDPRRDIYNEATAEVRGFSEFDVARLWTHPQANATASTLTFDGGAADLQQWAYFPSAGSAAGAVAWEWAVAAAWTANSAADGSGTNLTGYFAVVNTQAGLGVTEVDTYATRALVRLHQTAPFPGGIQKAYFTDLYLTGYAVKRLDAVKVSAIDTASQTKYGQRSYPIPGPWLPNVLTAQSYVDQVVARYKDPRPILSVAMLANRSAAQLVEVLGRDISDRITLEANRTTTGGTNLGVREDFFVEAITGHIERSGRHTVVYDLSEADWVGVHGVADHWWVDFIVAEPGGLSPWILEPWSAEPLAEKFLLMGV